LLATIYSIAFSQEKIEGEIINVNHQYRIAFTDVSSHYLRVTDIVEVYAEGNFLGYLEVAETSGIISKLIPVRQKVNFKTDINFPKVAVGNRVVKIMPSDATRADVSPGNLFPIPDRRTSGDEKSSDAIERMEKEKKKLQDDYTDLLKKLEISFKRIEELEAENMNLSQENNALRKKGLRKRYDPSAEKIKMMREANAVLKKKLEYMFRLVNENIKAHEAN